VTRYKNACLLLWTGVNWKRSLPWQYVARLFPKNTRDLLDKSMVGTAWKPSSRVWPDGWSLCQQTTHFRGTDSGGSGR
jgi:hypothetical protein